MELLEEDRVKERVGETESLKMRKGDKESER